MSPLAPASRDSSPSPPTMRKTILRILGEALAAKDPTTQAHVLRTRVYAVGIARNMNCSKAALRNVETAALLHDIGKVYIDQRVLTKPERLDEAEIEQMRTHSAVGAELATKLEMHPMICAGIRHHHERWDGRGYPDGIAGTEIPFVARVVAVADVYDALTSPRCYRADLPKERALALMRAGDGKQFDPEVLGVFLRYLSGFEEEVASLDLPQPTDFGVQLEAAAERDAA
jgi:putative nucleotidyltransferase with HDIG domain